MCYCRIFCLIVVTKTSYNVLKTHLALETKPESLRILAIGRINILKKEKTP